MDLPPEVTKVREFSDGTVGLECAFCEGTGIDGDDPDAEPCSVCKGSGIGLVAQANDALVWCRACDARGRSWDDGPCLACGGRGLLSLSALTGGQSPTGQADLWDLMHPDVVRVAKTRFDSGQFADAVEAAFKHFNSVVKERASSRILSDLDGAKLMNQVFSPSGPIIRLSDLSTETGKNIQQGYMLMFAGAMTGIRNPTAHGNITIDPNRAVHLLFVASLFLRVLNEAHGQAGPNEGVHPSAQELGGG